MAARRTALPPLSFLPARSPASIVTSAGDSRVVPRAPTLNPAAVNSPPQRGDQPLRRRSPSPVCRDKRFGARDVEYCPRQSCSKILGDSHASPSLAHHAQSHSGHGEPSLGPLSSPSTHASVDRQYPQPESEAHGVHVATSVQ